MVGDVGVYMRERERDNQRALLDGDYHPTWHVWFDRVCAIPFLRLGDVRPDGLRSRAGDVGVS